MRTPSERDQKFLRRRRTAARALPRLGALCAVAWIGLWGFLLWRQPLLTNPLHVTERIGRGDLDPATLTLLAGAAPVASSLLFAVVLAFLLIAIGFALEQRRLLRIIDALRDGDPSGGS